MEFLLIYISSENNIADLLTKSLLINIIRNLIANLGLYKLGEA